MTTQPEPAEVLSIDGVEYLRLREPQVVLDSRSCGDCGRRVELDDDGNPFAVCRACYDAYVDNAGR
jgi:hypothetical protein